MGESSQRVSSGKALIKVGYACNEHCSFCHTLEVRHIQGSTAEVDAKIRRAAELGHEMVVLSGGEPTIRPELVHWAGLTASLGMDFGLVTNGQMLAYEHVVEELLERRLRYVYLSLHGGTRKIHNLMVRSDAFDAAFKAVENLAGRGLDFSVNCVITRHNLEHLTGLVDALMPFPDLTVKFSMVEPKGGGDKLFAHLMPRIEDVAEKVIAAIEYGEEQVRWQGQTGPRFTHGAIPLCLLPGYEDRYDDLKTHAYRTMIEVGEPDYFPVDDLNKTQDPLCRGCSLSGPCPGLYTGYHEVFGPAELRPIRDRPRSNSFNYELQHMVELGFVGEEAEGCPLRRGMGVTPWDYGRDLFVRNGTRVARYRAESRDFSDQEIAAVKHGLGQVYVDVSKKAAPDDFARDLIQLVRSRVCASCPERERCTGMFEPLLEDVFTRDDAEVREVIAGLRGDVLDLGCGEGPYAALLAPLARAGTIRYLGVDPHAQAIADLRQRWPWAELLEADGETLELAPDRRFDHVLILRAWNHLRDPAAVLARLIPRLRPGGSLTLVDNVAFGLARGRAQTHRGERSRAIFEHYRNDTLADAERIAGPVVEALGMRALSRREVGPERSNQWLLRYELPAG
ncbi:radical SAM protein [Pseudenhygromyxa sp. WMMC2535]|uniref:radical SAM protein n=1 Tax=Pseudenhygromyxa sp. WMMC2535 TaxID=2712867 RepID=UPI0015549B7B|nr:radical SAM protein [Pseudenhygromyxa sp. WMMC2535]